MLKTTTKNLGILTLLLVLTVWAVLPTGCATKQEKGPPPPPTAYQERKAPAAGGISIDEVGIHGILQRGKDAWNASPVLAKIAMSPDGGAFWGDTDRFMHIIPASEIPLKAGTPIGLMGIRNLLGLPNGFYVMRLGKITLRGKGEPIEDLDITLEQIPGGVVAGHLPGRLNLGTLRKDKISNPMVIFLTPMPTVKGIIPDFVGAAFGDPVIFSRFDAERANKGGFAVTGREGS